MGIATMTMVALIGSGCADSRSAKSKSMSVSDQNAVRWTQLMRRSHALTATREGSNYEYAFGRSLGLSWRDIVTKCYQEIAKPVGALLSGIASIDAGGRITEFAPEPGSLRYPCFEAEISLVHYPEPPESPFYEVFHIQLRLPPKR
jgi:hypothetical protein